jgi:hypothetical protein
MADFARWGEACSRSGGKAPGEFLRAYAANQSLAKEIALESSPAAMAVIQFMSERDRWVGTAENLLFDLEAQVEPSRRRRGWPGSPRGLGGALRRVLSGLREAGIAIDFGRDSSKARTRVITLQRNTSASE